MGKLGSRLMHECVVFCATHGDNFALPKSLETANYLRVGAHGRQVAEPAAGVLMPLAGSSALTGCEF